MPKVAWRPASNMFLVVQSCSVFRKRGMARAAWFWSLAFTELHDLDWQVIDVAPPFWQFHAVPDQMLDVLFFILTTSPTDVCNFRISKMKLWMSWAEELEAQEREHKLSLDPEVRQILAPKRLLLLRKIARSLDWPDTNLFDEIDAGFKLTGIQSPSNVFGLEPRPPQASEGELWASAKFIRPALIGKVKSAALDTESQPLWDATMEEVSNHHWMTGPHTVEQVHDIFNGQPWIPVRRFSVLQSSGDRMKLRPIDDFAENRVNTAYGYSDKLDLRTLDQVVWMTAAITRALALGYISFRRSDGTLLEGRSTPLIWKRVVADLSFLFWICHQRTNNLRLAKTAGGSLLSPLRILQTVLASVSLAMCCHLGRQPAWFTLTACPGWSIPLGSMLDYSGEIISTIFQW